MLRNKNYTLLYFIILLFLLGCSAERKNIISKAYHNTTARYNAYFYAKNDIKDIKEIVKSTADNDYNKVLKIYAPIDSVLASTYKEQVDDCIKKSSLVIQIHKNSKWVDDSYVLIGLARFYSLDYVNAIETFKYVNTKSEDDETRHLALAHLHRTFTDYGEYNNAIAVSDYLKKETLDKKSSKILYLNQAHYYQTQGDLNNMVVNLVKAAPLLKRKDGKGRIYFIIAQVYQDLGFDSEAYNYYKKCIASNPEYELDFYARLYMAQVTELGKSGDLRAARKHFKQLLKDKKNVEYKDKIYYEMAEFELRQGNMDQAISYFKSSIYSSTNNNRQKGQSYLRIGQIEYDSMANYELAKNYYDSAVQTLPPDFENYAQIQERQQILEKFVNQHNTIHLQDSLLNLSTLDSVAIRATIDSYLAAKAEEQRKIEEKKKIAERRRQFTLANEDSGIGNATGWYFGNPSAVALGQTEFQRIWGDRALEDNWRISRVQGNLPSIETGEMAENNVEVLEGTQEAPEENTTQEQSSEANKLYAQIPFSDEAKEKSLNMIKEAYYILGNIYYFELQELQNAALTFEKLLTRFPGSENEAEVLYQLYLINKTLNRSTDIYKNQLLEQYPNTTYAKLLSNPNYTEESTAANEQLKVVYKNAYALFKNEEYKLATQKLDSALNNIAETVFSPRLRLLKILIVGKTENINLYQYQLSDFIEKNPDSDILPYAKELLQASKNFQEKQQRLLGTEFVKYFKQNHYFILVYESGKNLADDLSQEINDFNQTLSNNNLKTSNLILNEKYDMVMVTGLGQKDDAAKYYEKFINTDAISEDTKNSKFYKFVITKDNFNIFYQTKDLEAYLRFFNKNYINGL
ncbi:type IX secretion system periplasmic lipoprotein PorW/SprE [Fulvivirga sediminis]|uniref:Tetratricopeptide repeat protein n=1 Tax=Fulvivirga sediminis TaxID=2803949 RepID=A0A937FAR5_9BACT|nr:tetratricopeptide repeat protein [Fulvivirga sediminis]MBL3657749.1 tetratricopeptide repeat protein [Fulvivirga sediminis]